MAKKILNKILIIITIALFFFDFFYVDGILDLVSLCELALLILTVFRFKICGEGVLKVGLGIFFLAILSKILFGTFYADKLLSWVLLFFCVAFYLFLKELHFLRNVTNK